MNLNSDFWSRTPIRRLFFVLITLDAWITTASLFMLLGYAPLTRGAPLLTWTPVLVSTLPWLAACSSWAQVRKKTKSGALDRDSASFCYSIIIMTVGAAYVVVLNIEPVLFQALSRAK